MLALLSPSKNLDFSPIVHPPATAPLFAKQTLTLSAIMAKKRAADLKRMMGVSDALADLNVARYRAFNLDDPEGLPAALAFSGDVYRGLDARSLSAADLTWAQDHVAILSGLYGYLRPLDRLQPYRLEMGTRLKTRRGDTLYDFWRRDLAPALDAAASAHARPVLLNLASDEYFKAVDMAALKTPVVRVTFKEIKDGKARALFMFLKVARGLMARWMIENRIEDPEDLKAFNVEGYRFDAEASQGGDWVFTRPQPAKKTPERAGAAR